MRGFYNYHILAWAYWMQLRCWLHNLLGIESKWDETSYSLQYRIDKSSWIFKITWRKQSPSYLWGQEKGEDISEALAMKQDNKQKLSQKTAL